MIDELDDIRIAETEIQKMILRKWDEIKGQSDHLELMNQVTERN